MIKNITLSRKNWNKMREIKNEHDELKYYNDVIGYLLNRV